MSKYVFTNFTVLSMETPITNCLQCFFRTDGDSYRIIMSHDLSKDQNKSLIFFFNVIRDKTYRKD